MFKSELLSLFDTLTKNFGVWDQIYDFYRIDGVFTHFKGEYIDNKEAVYPCICIKWVQSDLVLRPCTPTLMKIGQRMVLK